MQREIAGDGRANGTITTCSVLHGEVPGVDLVDLVGHHPTTQGLLQDGSVEVVAERSIRRLQAWSVVVRRVKQAAPVVGGIATGAVVGVAAGVAARRAIEHFQKKDNK